MQLKAKPANFIKYDLGYFRLPSEWLQGCNKSMAVQQTGKQISNVVVD